MIRGAKAFARLGLAAGAVAILLAATVTGSVAEQKTALAAAFLLALCEVAAALVAAGPEERKRRPLAWVRVGLFAALASFIAIFALAIPTVFATVMTGAGGFVEVPDDGTTTTFPATPADFGGTPWSPRWMAPARGQHGDEVLGELGKSAAEIAALRASGTVI